MALTFPDLPRLELDQLLMQLVDRAHEVMGTQGRLRGLLRANQLITGDLTLEVVLRRIVQAAQELVGARYAALGVIGPEGGLIEFVHTGMPDATVQQIGDLPQGKGLLGALIDDPRPIRLGRINDDPRSSGFPAGHPPMGSFLGVPIRIRDDVFGNLYLSESVRGEFTAEDEELLTALAATAAAVIDNARLYASARSRGEWLQATAAITRQLLTPTSDGPQRALQMIAERALSSASANLVYVVLPTGPDGGLCVEVAVGAGADIVQGRSVPLIGSLSGRVLTSGDPLRLKHPDDAADLRSIAADVLDVGPVLVVPLRGMSTVHGVLATVRVKGRPAFTADEVDMAASFANQATVAVELAEARARQQDAALDSERSRIAADLQDHVIKGLFATGLSLQGVAGQLGPGSASDRLAAAVRDLDTVIKQTRSAIFDLKKIAE
jgi:GAF domain-containing protein